jgi:hypothetical protein
MLVGDYLKNVVREELTVALPDTLVLYKLFKQYVKLLAVG